MKKVKIIFSIIILFLFIINYANAPLPPPYYIYYFGGTIKCDTLIDKSNYSMALFGMHNVTQPEYKILNGMSKGNEKPISLTDTSGKYLIVVSDWHLFDSLKVGWVSPHAPILFSEPYFVDKSKLIEISETYQQSSSGCSSCSSTAPAETRIIRYEYNQSDTELNLCNK